MKRIQKELDNSYYRGDEQRQRIMIKKVQKLVFQRGSIFKKGVLKLKRKVMSPNMAEGGFAGCFCLFCRRDTQLDFLMYFIG